MAGSNINKTEKFLTNTNAASKKIPKRPIASPFRPHFIKFSKYSHLEVLLLRKFGTERRGSHLKQILGLLGMYFDAAAVFVKNFSLLFRLALAIHTVQNGIVIFDKLPRTFFTFPH